MALAVPDASNWVVCPHFASYFGLIDGRDASPRNKARLIDLRHIVEPTGYAVAGTLHRRKGKLTQDSALISPEDDLVIYVERLRVVPGFARVRPASSATNTRSASTLARCTAALAKRKSSA
jgi:hypothetical protein